MSIILWLVIICCSVTVFVDVLLIYLWAFHKKEFDGNTTTPFISILIAARNEEKNIKDCIDSILRLDYPKEKFEILVGDDDSSDATSEIIKANYGHINNLSLIKITSNLGIAKGKANVLAQLAKKAGGDIFFITDADIAVPKTWIGSMLKALDGKVGIVNGFTVVKDSPYQNIDWILALGMIKVISDSVQPVTAIGNNMLVTREAYQSIGGYESIPFSVTEDFDLFKQVSKKGFMTRQLANSSVKCQTKSKSSLFELLHQRKRWMKGAVQLPLPIVTILIVQALYFPSIIILFIFNAEIAFFIIALKLLFQSLFVILVSTVINERINFLKTVIFEFYSALIALVTMLFYLLPIKIRWKGRKY